MLIAANWKMNGLRRDGIDRARALAGFARNSELSCGILLCPPATLLGEVRGALDGSGIRLGGQDCHTAASGAHTGDISAEMLADMGCTDVIVGHSERRADHGETDEFVRNKAEAAHRAGLCAVICVGESEADRDAGQALDVVTAQLHGSVPEGAHCGNTVIAYEPCWAIGTGRTPTVGEIGEMHNGIHAWWASKFSDGADELLVLYGGSVKAANAAEILAAAGVGGALVGGASLDAEEFWRICQAAG